MPNPFTDYVQQKYLDPDQEPARPTWEIPGSDEGVSLAFYRDKTLQDAGWTDDARKWALNYPISLQERDEMPGVLGLNFNTEPRGMAISRPRPGNSRRDADYGQTVEHEMIHAWDANKNFNYPDPLAWDKLRTELGLPSVQDDWWEAMRGSAPPTWRGAGQSVTWPDMDEPAHANQNLFNMGLNVTDLPAWYRRAYLDEYKQP